MGIALRKDLVYSPDWGFFIGVVVAFLCLILMSIFVIGYVYRKSWKTKTAKGMDIDYQRRHYESVKNEDPEDPDSIISINADSQSFYVLNQGKEIIRTKAQLKAKRAQEKAEREKRKKEREEKKRVLELEHVEQLKDKLNKHMQEIRKLFGLSTKDIAAGAGEEEANLESLPDGELDPNVANQKLIDQIMKLKLLINENRRALEGDQNDDDDLEQQKEELERKEKERIEVEKKIKEEQEKIAKEEKFEKAQEEIVKQS